LFNRIRTIGGKDFLAEINSEPPVVGNVEKLPVLLDLLEALAAMFFSEFLGTNLRVTRV
jgi:hypothetical protein